MFRLSTQALRGVRGGARSRACVQLGTIRSYSCAHMHAPSLSSRSWPRARSWLTGLALTSLLSACDGDGGTGEGHMTGGESGFPNTGSDAEGSIDLADFLDRQRQAHCEFRVRCGLSPSSEVCVRAVGHDPGLRQAVGGVAFARTQYDAQAAHSYVETLAGLACARLDAAQAELDAAREAVFQGRVAEAQPCFDGLECAGTAKCVREGCDGGQVCCPGLCRARVVLERGDACPLDLESSTIQGDCGPDDYCASPVDASDEVVDGSCTPRVDRGQPCTGHDQCMDGMRCSLGNASKCFVLSAADEMCNPMLQEGGCLDLDRWCNPSSSTCTRLPAPGESCEASDECLGLARCIEGQCVARPVEGEPCPDDGPACLASLRCREGICEVDQLAFVCIDAELPESD